MEQPLNNGSNKSNAARRFFEVIYKRKLGWIFSRLNISAGFVLVAIVPKLINIQYKKRTVLLGQRVMEAKTIDSEILKAKIRVRNKSTKIS